MAISGLQGLKAQSPARSVNGMIGRQKIMTNNPGSLSWYARKAYRKHFGPIPKGFDVHHKDRDRKNNVPENLQALSRRDHLKLHIEEDPWWTLKRVGNTKTGKKRGIYKLESLLNLFNNNDLPFNQNL